MNSCLLLSVLNIYYTREAPLASQSLRLGILS